MWNMGKKKKTTDKKSTKEAKAKDMTEENLTAEAVDNQEVTNEEVTPVDELTELKQQVGEQKDKYLRLYAEFENYKRRTVREKLDLMSTAARDTLSALLPVLDDFDRAKKNAAEGEFSEGIELVYNKLNSTVTGRGLKEMESNGEVFDPEFHEAITEIPAPTEDMKGKVIDTVEKGYFLNEKIIRYAKVVVGK